jgi:hypothetical protein
MEHQRKLHTEVAATQQPEALKNLTHVPPQPSNGPNWNTSPQSIGVDVGYRLSGDLKRGIRVCRLD